MDRALKRLERVLELEKQQGYKNKAVVGGIGQFGAFWVAQAREEATGEADLALAEQVAEVLAEYHRLPGTEARAKAIDSLMTSIRHQEASPESARSAEISRPPERPKAHAPGTFARPGAPGRPPTPEARRERRARDTPRFVSTTLLRCEHRVRMGGLHPERALAS